MSAAEITTIISNVGFPIAAFLLLYRFIDKTMKENTAALLAMKEAMMKVCEKIDEKTPS